MILISNRRIDRALWNFHRMACTESPPHTHRRIDRALWYFRRMACPESPWPQSNGRIDRALWYFRRMACTEFSPFSPIPTLPVKLDSYTIIVLWSWHQLEEFIELNDISVELLVLSPPPHPLLLPYAKWYYEKKNRYSCFRKKKNFYKIGSKLAWIWIKMKFTLDMCEKFFQFRNQIRFLKLDLVPVILYINWYFYGNKHKTVVKINYIYTSDGVFQDFCTESWVTFATKIKIRPDELAHWKR